MVDDSKEELLVRKLERVLTYHIDLVLHLL